MRIVARAQSVPRRLGFGEGLCLGLAVERVLGAFDDKQATEARSDRADAVAIDGGDAAFDVLDLVNVERLPRHVARAPGKRLLVAGKAAYDAVFSCAGAPPLVPGLYKPALSPSSKGLSA